MKPDFVFGVQYYRPPTPREEDWEKDLALIKKSGLNTIKIWMPWGWIEPAPDEFRFEDYDKLFDLARQNELMVVPNIIVESAPFWFPRLYPGTEFVNNDGKTIISQVRAECSGGITPGPCLDHEVARERAERFIKAVASRYSKRKNLLCWDVWNEIVWQNGMTDQAVQNSKNSLACYCPKTVEKFRRWLEKKHGNIKNLNKAWGRRYINWGDVYPPLRPWRQYADMLDWRMFMIENVTEKAKWRVDTVKSIDSNHPVMLHTGGSSLYYLWGQIPRSGADDWKLAATTDFYGTSFWPGAYDFSDETYAFLLDATRSSSRDKDYWVSELQGGSFNVGLQFSNRLSPQRQRFLVWSAISKGAKGILFWSWRGERMGREAPTTSSLTNLDGSLSQRTEMVKGVSDILEKSGKYLQGTESSEAQVAILFDPEVSILAWCADIKETAEMYGHSLEGYHNLLWKRNIPVDFLHLDDIRNLNQYKVLVMPFPLLVRKKTAEIIKRYVEDGGTVIAEAFLGRFSDNAFCSAVAPGNGLDSVFCAKVNDIEQGEKIELTVTKENPIISLMESGDKLPGYHLKENLTPLKDGEVIAHFEGNNPAIIAGKYGKGQTVLIGSFLGYAYALNPDKNISKLIESIVSYAGVSPTGKVVSENNDFIELRVLKGRDYNLLFCLNYGNDTKAEISIDANGREDNIKEILSGEKVPYRVESNKVILKTVLREKMVKVFLVEESRKQ